MPAPAPSPQTSGGYQLRVVKEILLALLAQAPNAGQVYVTLARLEKAGLIRAVEPAGADRPDRKVYALTATGRERVETWLHDTGWPKATPSEFHLKLVAA